MSDRDPWKHLEPDERRSIHAQGDLVDGKYLLGPELGEGGMASVFLAEDVRLRREVAIKIARPRVANDPSSRTMFMREAESMATLRHPNVVEIYDVGQTESCPYLVMPYRRGADLETWCERQGGPPVPMDVAIGILGQACAGVAALHAAGLVHRDIKPQNILVLGTFEVVVADLGLTHVVGRERRPGGLFGTPGFMAPELLREGPLVDGLAHKADVYAMGVTAYWLLTGRFPTSIDLMELFGNGVQSIVAPSEVRPDLPISFDAPVLDALEPDPELRVDIVELRAALFQARDTLHSSRRRRSPFIVVVDDDPQALLFIESVLRVALDGPEIAALTDPAAALGVIESRPPDLVITDLQMPQINGIELTAILRGFANTRDVPVIVLTGVGGAAEWHLLRELGVVRFLVKPIDPDTLHDVIRRVMLLV